MEFEGLTEFQKDLLEVAQNDLPKQSMRLMKKAANRGATHAKRVARSEALEDTGLYIKKFKGGRAFKVDSGTIVARVINSAPHAHLLEYGHMQVVNPGKGPGNGLGVIPGRGIGKPVGFIPGFHVLDKAMKNFNSSGDFEKVLAKGLDEMLLKKGL